MEAKDLIVGDWVTVTIEDEKINGRIDKIDGQTEDLRVMLSYYPDDWEEGDFFDFIEPIPITPEILEKNGFEEEVREGDPTFPYSAFILDGDDYHIEITWYDSHDRYEPNTGQFLGGAPEVWAIEVYSKRSNVDIERSKMYVHELQHALRLCGIEKEIKL